MGYRCVDQITSQFNDPMLGKRASERFEVLIGESDLLNKQSFAVVKVYIFFYILLMINMLNVVLNFFK